jgi:hypothetical protein
LAFRIIVLTGHGEPYDRRDPYDELFEEGVGNFNLWRLHRPMSNDPFWVATNLLPETKPAVVAYARAPYLGLLTVDELIERYRMLCLATKEMSHEGFVSPTPWSHLHDKWIHTKIICNVSHRR